MNKKNAP